MKCEELCATPPSPSTHRPLTAILPPPTGRTICKLHLAPGGLHADIDGDGTIDHVHVRGGAHGAAPWTICV